LKDEEGLLAAVGYGRITSQQVLSKLLPPDELKEQPAAKPEGALKKLFRLVARQQSGRTGRDGGVRVSGVEDMLVRFGRCCNPLPGERIAGFITRGRGVTVHSANCARVLESDPARRVDVVWAGEAVAPRPVKVEVVSVDQPGMLASISKVISSSGINIARAEVRTDGQEQAVSSFHLMVTSADVLNHVMRNIGKLRGVLRVSRVAA
jgi:GTP pyrophosphokinase